MYLLSPLAYVNEVGRARKRRHEQQEEKKPEA